MFVVGGDCTVKVKARLAVLIPSLTVTVICADPVLPDAGVTETVRFVPLPANRMFAFGTSTVEEESPDNVKLSAGVSASLMVNGKAEGACPGFMVSLEMTEIVGGWLETV